MGFWSPRAAPRGDRDAQTSGGLLVATPDGAALLRALAAAGVEGAAQIGEVTGEDALGTIEVAP